MPALGADMQFGTVVSWRVKSGDQVKRGDVVALVETEKGVVEVEIFESGVIESLVVPPGQKVPVGSTLAILRGDGAPAVPTEAARATAEKPAAPTEEQRPAIAPAVVVEDQPAKRSAPHIFPVPEAGVRARFSPLARKRAAELAFPVVTVNPSTPIGPRDVKPTPTGRILLDAAAGRMPAFVDTGLNLVHVDDVAAGHLAAAKRGAPGMP